MDTPMPFYELKSVGDREFDAKMMRLGKSQTAVHQKEPTLMNIRGHVAAEFSAAPKKDYFKVW